MSRRNLARADWIAGADHKAESNCAGACLSGLLLRSGRTWATRSPGRMAKTGVAKTWSAEARSADDKRMPWPLRCANVVAIVAQQKTVWLGNLTRQDQYQSLLDWASRSKDLGRAADIPKELLLHLLEDPVSV